MEHLTPAQADALRQYMMDLDLFADNMLAQDEHAACVKENDNVGHTWEAHRELEHPANEEVNVPDYSNWTESEKREAFGK